MLRLILTGYFLIFLCFLSYAATFSHESLVPVLGFYLLIYPTFLMCCAVVLSFFGALPAPSFARTPRRAVVAREDYRIRPRFFPGLTDADVEAVKR
ncbi:MAG: hypothetical protein U1E83_04425 [Methylotetracoccus sp.]